MRRVNPSTASVATLNDDVALSMASTMSVLEACAVVLAGGYRRLRDGFVPLTVPQCIVTLTVDHSSSYIIAS